VGGTLRFWSPQRFTRDAEVAEFDRVIYAKVTERMPDSIGRPLPGRHTIVVTRNAGFKVEGVIAAPSLREALDRAREVAGRISAEEIIVAGGGEIYRQAIDLAQRLYITEVDLAPAGDVHFPAIDAARWREVRREKFDRGERDDADSVFVEYERLSDTPGASAA